jgi:hypothetical protein
LGTTGRRSSSRLAHGDALLPTIPLNEDATPSGGGIYAGAFMLEGLTPVCSE